MAGMNYSDHGLCLQRGPIPPLPSPAQPPRRYRGKFRTGTGCVGSLKSFIDVAEWVEQQFKSRRWDWLTVEDQGNIIGEICQHPDTGNRIWWAEK